MTLGKEALLINILSFTRMYISFLIFDGIFCFINDFFFFFSPYFNYLLYLCL